MFWSKKDEEEKKRRLEEQRTREEKERQAKKLAKKKAVQREEARKKRLEERKKLNDEEAQAYLEMLGLAEPSAEGGAEGSAQAPRKEEVPVLNRGLGTAATPFSPNGFKGFGQTPKPKDPANPLADKGEREQASSQKEAGAAKAEASANFPRLQRPF